MSEVFETDPDWMAAQRVREWEEKHPIANKIQQVIFTIIAIGIFSAWMGFWILAYQENERMKNCEAQGWLNTKGENYGRRYKRNP